MAARDPETGQFVSSQDRFDDYELVSINAPFGIPAGSLTGGTGFEGGQVGRFEGTELLDYDDIVDRHETLHLVAASHRLHAYMNSTETADGTVRASVEVSSSPSADVADDLTGSELVDDTDTDNVEKFTFQVSDSIDIIGRPLLVTAHAPFSDGASGVGGAGTAADDTVEVRGLPDQLARFHPRDELFANGTVEVWNVDDAGLHFELSIQHLYGVVSDD